MDWDLQGQAVRSSHHESLHHRLLKLGFYCQPVQVSEIRHWRTEMFGFYILSQSQKNTLGNWDVRVLYPISDSENTLENWDVKVLHLISVEITLENWDVRVLHPISDSENTLENWYVSVLHPISDSENTLETWDVRVLHPISVSEIMIWRT